MKELAFELLFERGMGLGSERFQQPTLDYFLAPISFKIGVYNVHFSWLLLTFLI